MLVLTTVMSHVSVTTQLNFTGTCAQLLITAFLRNETENLWGSGSLRIG